MLAHQERGKNTLQKSNNKVLLGICDGRVGLPTVRIAHGIGMITGMGMSFALNMAMALAGEEQVQQAPGHSAFIDAPKSFWFTNLKNVKSYSMTADNERPQEVVVFGYAKIVSSYQEIDYGGKSTAVDNGMGWDYTQNKVMTNPLDFTSKYYH